MDHNRVWMGDKHYNYRPQNEGGNVLGSACPSVTIRLGVRSRSSVSNKGLYLLHTVRFSELCQNPFVTKNFAKPLCYKSGPYIAWQVFVHVSNNRVDAVDRLLILVLRRELWRFKAWCIRKYLQKLTCWRGLSLELGPNRASGPYCFWWDLWHPRRLYSTDCFTKNRESTPPGRT